MKFRSKGLGMILLSLWLVLTGLFPLLNVHFAHEATVMEVLAVAAGVFLFASR